jgi:hypothetical protein
MAQGKGRRVRDTPDENPAHLELAMTALAGVVPLLGGIAEEHCHLSIPLGWCLPVKTEIGVSGRRWRRHRRRTFLGSIVLEARTLEA